MTYSGANTVRQARESLGKALEALQQDTNIPDDVMAVAQNIAQSVGALFEAERASSEVDGKACVKNALGSLSQTLALLQDVRSKHGGIATATEVIATAMSNLYPLTTVPSKAPPPQHAQQPVQAPAAPRAPQVQAQPPQPAQAPAGVTPSMRPPSAPAPKGESIDVEVNIGATTESNFYVGFSGEISDGGVFLSTYEVLGQGTHVNALVTLPGNFEFRCKGWVRFVRDPFDLNSESEPGIGIQFIGLDANARELVLRFIRKRPPMFYED